MTPLQQRAKAFLEMSIPDELAPNYVPGSIADMMIANYAAGKKLDAEALELIELAGMESEAAADNYETADAKAYFQECAAILSAISEELG